MEDQEFTLTAPIKVSNDGNLDDCFIITLVSPVKKFIRKTYKLQQYFMKAQVQQAELFSKFIEERENDDDKEDDDKEEVKITSNQVMQMLLSSDVDIEAVVDEFERLALLGAVTINGIKPNPIQWGAISDDDKEGLMTKYLSFFISTLAMKSFQ